MTPAVASAQVLDDLAALGLKVTLIRRGKSQLVSGREHDLAFLPGLGVNNKGEPLPTVALERRFEPAVMVCMSVRDDERAQVSDRHLQDIQVAGESGRCQAPVVQK